MTDIFSKLRKSLEDALDTARHNAISLKDTAGEYSRVARLKFDIHQLNSSKRKKMELLGETVFPFIQQNNIDGLKKHDTLQILIDDIKNVNNEIELTQKALHQLNQQQDNVAAPGTHQQEQLQKQIDELESEIEDRLQEIKIVKEAINSK